jgi:hypothetical protein
MNRTQRYQFTVDESENCAVRMVDGPLGQYAGTKDMVLRNAEAMAVGWFGHEFFCGVDEVRILDSRYDENISMCNVTVEGPVGDLYERQIQIPEPLSRLMAACETACVAGCLEEANRQLEGLIKAVESLGGERFSRQLNFYGNSDEWVTMLGQWKEAIKAVMK